jgi:hypothetical protein
MLSADVGDEKNVYKTLVGKPEEKTPLRRQSINSSIILKWILGK